MHATRGTRVARARMLERKWLKKAKTNVPSSQSKNENYFLAQRRRNGKLHTAQPTTTTHVGASVAALPDTVPETRTNQKRQIRKARKHNVAFQAKKAKIKHVLLYVGQPTTRQLKNQGS